MGVNDIFMGVHDNSWAFMDFNELSWSFHGSTMVVLWTFTTLLWVFTAPTAMTDHENFHVDAMKTSHGTTMGLPLPCYRTTSPKPKPKPMAVYPWGVPRAMARAVTRAMDLP